MGERDLVGFRIDLVRSDLNLGPHGQANPYGWGLVYFAIAPPNNLSLAEVEIFFPLNVKKIECQFLCS